jgi:asparagine synthase (glutamine-hydrolysing)
MKESTKLYELLDSSVHRFVKDLDFVAVLFSGGLDSSVVAQLARHYSKVVLYTCGMQDSHDLKTAWSSSKLMGMPMEEILIDDNDVLEAIPEVERILDTKDPATVTITLPLYLTTKEVRERYILSGQGADELFGGYESKELEKELAKDIEWLICNGITRQIKIATEFNKEIGFPYLYKDLVNFALYLPTDKKVSKGERKVILRETAQEMGLPDEIFNVSKKAAQFGSGIARFINKTAKKRDQTLEEFFENPGSA